MFTRYQSDKEIETLVKRFENKTLPKSEWTHQAHLAVGLYYLHHHTIHESLCIMKARIITYNESVGGVNSATEGYHETLTVFWLSILDNYLKENKRETLCETCNEFFASKFFSKDLPLQYYDKEKLFSVEARSTWVEP